MTAGTVSQAPSDTGAAAFGGIGRDTQNTRRKEASTENRAETDETTRALTVRDDDEKTIRKKKKRRRRWVGAYGWAFIFTVAWVGLWAGYIYGYSGELPELSAMPTAWIAALLVGAIGPVAFFWMLAMVVRQSANMKRSADMMRAMADRLMRPEESAARDIQTVGTAVEHQIQKISAALDNAAKRIEKMEATLEKKVAALDEAGRRARAQTNDIKQELEQERQSLGSFAEKLHKEMGDNAKSIEGKLSDLSSTSAHAQKEMKRAEELVKSHLDAFRSAVATMSEGSEKAATEIGLQHDRLHGLSEVVAKRSDEVVQKYEQKRSDLDGMVRKLEGQSAFLDGAITRQRDFLGRMSDVFADQSNQLDEALGQARDKFEAAFGAMMAKAEDASEKFRLETLRSVDESNKAAAAISQTAEAASEGFKAKAKEAIAESDDAAAEFMLRAADMNKKIRVEAATVIEIGEDTAKAIREALATANLVAEDVRRSMHEQAQAINQSVGDSTAAAEAASEKLTARIKDSKTSAEELVTHLDKALSALGNAGSRLNETVDIIEGQSGKLQRRLEELSKDVESRIAQIPDTAASEAGRLREMFGTEITQMNALAKSVTDEAEKLQAAIQERRKLLIDMHRGMMDEDVAARTAPEPEPEMRADHSQDDEQFLGVFKRGQWSPSEEGGPHSEPPQDDSLPWPTDEEPVGNPSPSAPEEGPVPQFTRRKGSGLPEKGFWQTLFTRIDEEKEAEEQETGQSSTASGSRTPPPPPANITQLGDEAFQRASVSIIESLQAMAIDIDHLLEDTPPIELWQRYQHGEKNVFANRLLSLRTTGLAERIEQKYRQDSEFRDNADRYVRQFESLLDEAITRDRDNQLADSYLSSQTGKVYLLLGQSIGYFG